MEILLMHISKFLLVVTVVVNMTACGTTSTSQGASTGAIVGGLVDGWGGAAVGALIGGGVGYAVDSSEDKKKKQELKEREIEALEKVSITKDANTAYRPANSNPLTGRTETYGESYVLVGDVLVFTGDDYVTNTKYSIANKQLVLVAPTIRVVLEEIEESA
jgi:hypothetical protein